MAIIAALDTETTGFCEPEHRIVEVYIKLVDSLSKNTLFTYNQRINPKRNMPVEAQKVHGISANDLLNCPDWETVAPTIHKIISKSSLMVAHNAEFDVDFLNMEFERVGLPKLTMPSFCTMENGIWATPVGKKPSMSELCYACDVPYNFTLAHAADYDVERMLECMHKAIGWGFYELPV